MYQEPLYWHIRRMVVSHDDAQDVLQNTFLQIHLHLAQLRNAEQERAWVFKFATNEALQWLRSKHEWVSMAEMPETPTGASSQRRIFSSIICRNGQKLTNNV